MSTEKPWSELATKTDPIDEDIVAILDSEDSDVETQNKIITLGSIPTTVGESNTASNSGSGDGLAQPKDNVDLPFKSLLGETDKITLTANTNDVTFTVGSLVVTTDQANTFGLFTQTFKNSTLFIQNPATSSTYQFQTSAIGANFTVTLPLLLADDTFVFADFIQTLTNKTLSSPTITNYTNATHDHADNISGGLLTNSALTSGVFSSITGIGIQTQDLDMNGNNIVNARLPTDTNFWVDATVDTKRLAWDLSGFDTIITRTITVPNADTTLVGTDVTQTLINKTIALGSNTISGTLVQFNTALTDDSFATLEADQIFTGLNTFTDTLTIENDGDEARLALTAFNDATFGSFVTGSYAHGTLASPTGVVDNDVVFSFNALGHDGTDFGIGSEIEFIANGIWSITSHPMRIDFSTVPLDSVATPIKRLEIGSEGTADFQGNTINDATLTNTIITAAANTLTIASTDLSDTLVIVRTNETNTYDAFRQTFTPDSGGDSGLNVGSTTSDPTSPLNGDIYYDSATSKFRAFEDDVWLDMIFSGSTFTLNYSTVGSSSTISDVAIVGVTTAGITISIASAAILEAGRIFIIHDETGIASSSNIVIQGESSETIDGVSSILLVANFSTIRLYTNGTNLFTW